MPRMLLLAGVVLATGCSDPILVDGTVAGQDMAEPLTVFFGGPFIVFTDRPLECIEVPWVRPNYSPGETPTDFDFVGLQFWFDQGEVYEGVFSVEGDAAVYAKALIVEGGAFAQYTARTGTLVVDEVDGDTVSGSFDVGFGEEGGFSTTAFEAEFCVNLTR